jgi:DNA-binding MarR family transcriptional regulator
VADDNNIVPETARDESAERIIRSIRMLVRALDVLSKRLASEIGVTSPQLACLRYIVQRGTTSLTQVASDVSLSPSTVVGIIDRLEEKQLVARERDLQDRRVVVLTATPDGEELIGNARHPVQALFEDSKSANFVDADYQRIAKALEDVVGVLAEDDTEAELPLEDALGLDSSG